MTNEQAIAVLNIAIKRIETGENWYMCSAIAGATEVFNVVADKLRRGIMDAIAPHYVLSQWLLEHNPSKRDRWLDADDRFTDEGFSAFREARIAFLTNWRDEYIERSKA